MIETKSLAKRYPDGQLAPMNYFMPVLLVLEVIAYLISLKYTRSGWRNKNHPTQEIDKCHCAYMFSTVCIPSRLSIL